MPKIIYRGHTPAVSIPTYNLALVERGVPVEVPDDVAADLTLGGTSTTWIYADETDDDTDDETAEIDAVDDTPED